MSADETPVNPADATSGVPDGSEVVPVPMSEKAEITIRVSLDILPDFQENLALFIEDFYKDDKDKIEVVFPE